MRYDAFRWPRIPACHYRFVTFLCSPDVYRVIDHYTCKLAMFSISSSLALYQKKIIALGTVGVHLDPHSFNTFPDVHKAFPHSVAIAVQIFLQWPPKYMNSKNISPSFVSNISQCSHNMHSHLKLKTIAATQ